MEKEYYTNNKQFEVERRAHGPGWKMSIMHYHSSYEILMFENGSCNMLIDENIIPAEKYDIFLIAPNVLHKNNGGSLHTRTVLYFEKNHIEKFFTPTASEELLSCFAHKKVSVGKKDFEYIFALAMKLLKEPNDFISLGCILKFLSDCHPAALTEHRLIDSILHYINDNFANIDSLTDIAEQFYISKEHLCRMFKKETDMTVTEYLSMLRVRNACELLRTTNEHVLEICISCGFRSTAYFNRVFKKIMKMSPMEFRRSERGTHS